MRSKELMDMKKLEAHVKARTQAISGSFHKVGTPYGNVATWLEELLPRHFFTYWNRAAGSEISFFLIL